MGRASKVDFCCFAIPLINLGAYAICIEFAVIALCTAILAVAPPQIVATMDALPGDFTKIIVCILAILVLLWQAVGIVAIKREAPRLYRIYTRINFLLTLITIAATIIFFAVAAARHNAAAEACTAAYGSAPAGSQSVGTTDLRDVGRTICGIFTWVQVGFMGLLIALVGITQLSMCAVQRAYGKEIRHADRDVKSSNLERDDIPLTTRGSGIWDAPAAQRSYDDGYDSPKTHSRREGNTTYPSYSSATPRSYEDNDSYAPGVPAKDGAPYASRPY